ncbi:MAG TPA: hypothetical protein VMY78_16560 [Solirubrobacteraceae bacterium]|nr:hypothetical protein [Solirubrobacteraceae bacterium]
MKPKVLAVAVLVLVLLPSQASAATCSDYSNQAAAQAAADTRDADGDGVYCESLPCPCSTGGGGSTASPPPPPPPPAAAPKSSCTRTSKVQRLRFSATKYPNIKAHTQKAIAKGWPRILVLNRPNADKRRDRLLEESGLPPRADEDRDEYPPAVGRGRANGKQKGLIRGVFPLGWMADVAYVDDGENQSHGSSLGAKLRGFCNGTKFRYVFG